MSAEQPELDEEMALRIATLAVDEAGGTRAVHGSPRHPFAMNPSSRYEFEGHTAELRHGEISSPAIVTVGRYVFQIHEDEIELLMKLPVRSSGAQTQ